MILNVSSYRRRHAPSRCRPSAIAEQRQAVSPPAFPRSVQEPQTRLAPPACRTPPGQYSGTRTLKQWKAAVIEVTSVVLVPFSAISDADAHFCGEAGREAPRIRAAHAGPISDDTPVYRIEFCVADPPRLGA
jgi:hypothetical protein